MESWGRDLLPAVAGGEGVSIPLVDGRFMFGLAEGLVGVKNGDVRDVAACVAVM